MTTASKSLFDSVTLNPTDSFFTSLAAAEISRRARAATRTVPGPSASLWRQTMIESAADRRHRRITHGVLGLLSALGVGSVAYAAWATYALMGGSHLQDAVAAFMR